MSAPSPGTSSASPAPLTTNSPAEFFLQLLRAFIRGNGFYVISMILMVYGCHRLVRTVIISGAEAEFARTALSLAVLQAYEVLVIATAILLVKRLRVLGDAGTLLLIEAALLLDPTFFANSFLTMPGGRGIVVNAICLGLIPLKLALLQSMLSVRLSPRLWAGFLLAAVVVYLAPWPLDRERIPFLSLYGYYYALGALTFVLALLLPSAKDALHFGSEAPDDTGAVFATSSQRRWLPRFLIGLPILVAAAHYIETASVYTLAFYPANVGPLLLAGAVLLIANGTRGAVEVRRRIAIDLLGILAILLSVPPINNPSKYDMQRPTWALPEFVVSTIPLVCAGLGLAVVYGYYWIRLRDRAALRRLAAMGVIGALAGLWKTGVPAAIGRTAMSAFRSTGEYIGSGVRVVGSFFNWAGNLFIQTFEWAGAVMTAHPEIALLVFLAAAIWMARRYPNYFTWFTAGFLALVLVFRQLPGSFGSVIVEFLESIIILGILLSHRFRPEAERGQRVAAAFLVCAAGTLRLHGWPDLLAAVFVILQMTLLAVGAYHYRQRLYTALAAAQAISLMLAGVKWANVAVSPATVALAGGLLLFGLAVYVTFHKQRLLERLETPRPTGSETPVIPGTLDSSNVDNALDSPEH